MSTARNNYNVRYKSDHPVRHRTAEDLNSDLKKFNELCFEAILSKPFWSTADKIVFADKWTILTQRLLSHGKSLHGPNHRLVLDEDVNDWKVSR